MTTTIEAKIMAEPTCDVTIDEAVPAVQATQESEESSTLSPSAIEELVHLLISKGYFHDNEEHSRSVNVLEEDEDDSFQAFTKQKHQKQQQTLYNVNDASCQLVISRDGSSYMTRSYVSQRLRQELLSNNGRLSLEQAATLLNVDLIHVQRAALLKPNGDDDDSHIQQVGNDLIHTSHLDQLIQTAIDRLQTKGQLSLSDLVNQVFHLPMDLTLRVVSERMIECEAAHAILVTTLSGAKLLVSQAYWDERREHIHSTLLNAAQPTPLNAVCQETLGWSVESCNSLVLPWLRTVIISHHRDGEPRSLSHSQSQQQLPGELHESGSVQGAVYIPFSHIQSQRQAVDDFFTTNGYLTVDQCHSLGVRPSKLHDFVRESFPQAIALLDAVLHPDVLIAPLEAVVQEAVDNEDAMVDLSLHLPAALLSHVPICHAILNDLVLTNLAKRVGKEASELGIFVITNQDVYFYSHGLVERIQQTVLPGVIERFGKHKAEELDQLESPSRTAKPANESVEIESKAKEKRKTKKAHRDSGKSSSASIESESQLIVPLMDVASAIATEFPMFNELIKEPGTQPPQWEASEDETETKVDWVSGGPICEFCRVAFYTEDFRNKCHQSVEVELKRLRSKRESKASVISRKDAASKIRSVEQSFEDPSCFAAACYLLQLRAKGLAYMATANLDKAIYFELEREMLQDCCADFASRVTQYYLFKQGADDSLFSFSTSKMPEAQPSESESPLFCRPVDLTVRKYCKVYLSCKQQDAGLGRLPLSIMRDEGSVGVQLARLWNCCGGHCFQGGTRISDDGTDITKQGNVDEFLAQAEENCLMICGLPFKKLDKKSEKSTLFARRQALTRQLERAEGADAVLELTIVILFQQVKSIVVGGDHLRGAILDLLRKEKKMPEEVGNALGNLAEKINKGDQVNSDLLEAVRACGLSRDISKHPMNNN